MTDFRLWLARMICPADYDVARHARLIDVHRTLTGLAEYVQRSGHLTRAYKAGRAVTEYAATAKYALFKALS